jgi:predicted amidohydrolase
MALPRGFWRHVSQAKQAAGKGLDLIRTPEKHPSGPKGRIDFAALTARLKSCPDTKRLFKTHSMSFSAACKGPVDFCGTYGTTEVVP